MGSASISPQELEIAAATQTSCPPQELETPAVTQPGESERKVVALERTIRGDGNAVRVATRAADRAKPMTSTAKH